MASETTAGGTMHVLADGNRMPMLGLGVWQIPDGPECVNAVRWALELGYRHIDTAQAYENEGSVGRALREGSVEREDIFITTKFYPQREDPVVGIENSLRRLGVDEVDLYIVHWPQGGPIWAWRGMERAHELGYASSIGISNFDVDEVKQVKAKAEIAPVVNQVQFSPFEYRSTLLDVCMREGVALEAYSPLGVGKHLNSDAIKSIAEGIDRTPAQVLLRWCLQLDVPVVTKSTHRERIEENSQIFDFTLSNEDMVKLEALNKIKNTDQARERKWW